MDRKKYDEAVPLFRHFVEVTENPSQGYYKLAISERNLHQLEAAERDMNVFKTLSKSPQPAPYPLQHFFDYLERRTTLTSEQQNEAELRELQAEVQEHPDRQKEGPYLGLLGDVYALLNRYDEASKCLERAVAAVPDNDQYYLSLAVVQMRAGDTENADRVLRRGLARIPNSGFLYWAAGIVAVVRGHDRDAENLLKKASELSPSREALAATLGVFYYEEGRYSDARDLLKKGEEMFPQGPLDFRRIKTVRDAPPRPA